ncbi:DUF4362 domain-containing protein [Paenibacillus alba]|uniref:DUF4362 domain-containing protein n=1 Tax=Paenibacillus alba TaxID=1197127 RepID=A0ABU6GGD4_9BACL|nr:DUF4362 domain-containing protein [Paenibacillus alba]MEC0231699.1 DUF4362 domain-containing protein [Paenibacillus alba]
MKLNKLILLALTMSLMSGCQHTNAVDQPQRSKIKDTADVIDMHGGVTNLYKMDQFMKQVEQKEKASIRISHYTIEGDPIYNDIYFDTAKFELQYDTTQDQFGSKEITTYSCDELIKTETATEMKYTLNGCKGRGKSFDILHLSYDVSQQDLFEFQLKYGRNQAEEINTIDMKLVRDLRNGQTLGISDFQLNKEVQQNIYKQMVLSNYLSEKKFTACDQKPSYYLKVKINGGIREFNWSACANSEDNTTMTELANYIIHIVNSIPMYAEFETASTIKLALG